MQVNEFLKESCIHKFGSHQRLCHWTQEIMEDGVPQQEDGSGCGVYICVFADLLARGLEPPFSFSQKDIFQIRQGIAVELLAARGS
jgi:Ulp1 family protease